MGSRAIGTGPSQIVPGDIQPVTVLASAARTATVSSADQNNVGYSGLHVVIDATVDPGTASVTFTVEGKDPVSGEYYTLLASAAVASVSTTVLRVFPGATAAANTVANDGIPSVWRVTATHADAESITYSVAALPIL